MAGNKSTIEITVKYSITKSSVSERAKKYSKECKYTHTISKSIEGNSAKEIQRLKQILKEKHKEIEF